MIRSTRALSRFGPFVVSAMVAGALTMMGGTAGADVTYRSLGARHTFVSDGPLGCVGVNSAHYAVQSECSQPWSLFYIQPSDDGAWRIVTQQNKCLEVKDGALTEGAVIQEAGCNSNWKQQWWFNTADGDWREIVNRRSSLCMGVEGSHLPGEGLAYIEQSNCDHSYAEQFLASDCHPGDEPAICGPSSASLTNTRQELE